VSVQSGDLRRSACRGSTALSTFGLWLQCSPHTEVVRSAKGAFQLRCTPPQNWSLCAPWLLGRWSPCAWWHLQSSSWSRWHGSPSAGSAAGEARGLEASQSAWPSSAAQQGAAGGPGEEGALGAHARALHFALSYEATRKTRLAPGSTRWNSLGMARGVRWPGYGPGVSVGLHHPWQLLCLVPGSAALWGALTPQTPGLPCGLCSILRPLNPGQLMACRCLPSFCALCYMPTVPVSSLLHAPRQRSAALWPVCFTAPSRQPRKVAPREHTSLRSPGVGKMGLTCPGCLCWRHLKGERCPLRPLHGVHPFVSPVPASFSQLRQQVLPMSSPSVLWTASSSCPCSSL